MNSDTVSIIVEFGGFELFETFALINKTFYKEINCYYQRELDKSPHACLEAAYFRDSRLVLKKILAVPQNVVHIGSDLLTMILISYTRLHDIQTVKMLLTVLGKEKVSFLAQYSDHLRLCVEILIENTYNAQKDSSTWIFPGSNKHIFIGNITASKETSAAWIIPFFDKSVNLRFVNTLCKYSDIKALVEIETSCNHKFDTRECTNNILNVHSGSSAVIFFLEKLLKQYSSIEMVKSIISDLYWSHCDEVIEYIEKNVDKGLCPSAKEIKYLKIERARTRKTQDKWNQEKTKVAQNIMKMEIKVARKKK